MTTYIALLRGVNVAGKKQVAMSALRDLLAGLGFDDPRSLLQSGNLVFRSSTQPSAELEHLLETETEKRLHVRAAFFIRSAKEWATAIDANPFPDEAKHDPSHLVLMTLKDAPEAKAVKALRAAITGPELIRAKGRQLYITYPNGIGRSRLTNRLIEDKLTARGTGRNWNTVLKVAALARG
jgi:uncharacterized protein (DUF1697 family)